MDAEKFIAKHPVRWHIRQEDHYLIVHDANSDMLLAVDIGGRERKQVECFADALRLMVELFNQEYHW